MTFPYSDERMRYDEALKRYVLTPFALQERGYDLADRVTALGIQNPTQAVNGFLLGVSDMIYEYIHAHNIDNTLQDRMIAKIPELRHIIYRALIAQAVYMYSNGDLSLSTDDRDAGKEIATRAKRELETVVPGIGTCIVYTGRFPRWICST
jgi:hypothetical protein